MRKEYTNELNNSGIYQISNLINGKIYIGSTKCFKDRFYGHKFELKNNEHGNSYLQNAWNKYGENNFIFNIIEIVSDLDLLQEREQFWLDRTKCYERVIGYNILTHAFSTRGYKHTEEAKLKMSISNIGNKYSSKLTKADVVNIKLLLRDTDLTKTEIANLFNVNKTNIVNISISKLWKDIVITPVDFLCDDYLHRTIEIKNSRKPKKNYTKLIEDQVKIIKLLIRDTCLKQLEIGEIFGVSKYCISNIHNNKTWSEVIINLNDKLDSNYQNIVRSIVERR